MWGDKGNHVGLILPSARKHRDVSILYVQVCEEKSSNCREMHEAFCEYNLVFPDLLFAMLIHYDDKLCTTTLQFASIQQ